MQYVNLGKSGLKVSRICLGMMTYGTSKWRDWVLDEKTPTLELVREGDSLLLRIHFITRPDRLEREHRIVFGLQATPTKPMPEGWRRWVGGPPVPGGRPVRWVGATFYWGALSYDVYPYHYQFDIYEKLGDQIGMASGLAQIGGIHFRNNRTSEALACLQRSLELAKTYGDRRGVADALRGMGTIHADEGRYGQALECMRRSEKLYVELGFRAGVVSVRQDIGRALDAEGRLDEEVAGRVLEMRWVVLEIVRDQPMGAP